MPSTALSWGVFDSAAGLVKAIGRRGSWILLLCALLPLVFPLVAPAMRPGIEFGVWLFTFAAFAKADWAAAAAVVSRPARFSLVFGSSLLIAPLVAWMVWSFLPVDPKWIPGMAIAAAAPASGVAVVAMLGLDVSLGALLMLASVCCAPLLVPALLWALGVGSSMGPQELASRIAFLVAPPLAASLLWRRFVPAALARAQELGPGLAAIGLSLVALGAPVGVSALIAADPHGALSCLALAFAMNLGLGLASALACRFGGSMPWIQAFTVGVCSGNRNVSLAAVSASAFLAANPGAGLYVAMSFLPIFALPLALAPLAKRLARRSPVGIESAERELKAEPNGEWADTEPDFSAWSSAIEEALAVETPVASVEASPSKL